MNKFYLTLALLTVPTSTSLANGGEGGMPITALPDSLPEVTADDKVNFDVYWKNGLQFIGNDGDTKIQIGGRIYNDWAWFSADKDLKDDVGPFVNGTEMRSARIYMKGTIDERYFFKANYDFGATRPGDGGPGFKDVFMGLKKLPTIQNIQVGHFKEPIGLDVLTSSKYITFMERSLTGGSEPSRNTGVMVFGTQDTKRMTYAAGVFRDSNKFGLAGEDNGYAFTARVTGLPVVNDDQTSLIHLGIGVSHRQKKDLPVSYDPRPESHLAPRFLDTGDIAADSQDIIGLEWASINGPFYTQAEYVYTDIDGKDAGPSPSFSTYYGQASWFATNDSKTYLNKTGTFGRVTPSSPWGDGGWGALEFALRYSSTDLNNDGVEGGELSDITFGINWYLSSFSRLMFNYINADKDSVGTADIFQVRFQIDF